MRAILLLLLVSAIAVLSGPAPDAFAQDKGTLNPMPLPPLANPNDPTLAAKQLFGRKALPTAGAPHVIGFYAKGCIAGAEALPITGPTWQVMRLSRNRNWAYPSMVALLERLSAKVHKDAGWPGLLIGDMAQPRGGPRITGHASHQIGLDADVWLMPMPNRQLSRNRNWGHPKLIEFLERFAEKAPTVGWRGLLVGDMAQPRGGPMITGHASHQVGLDADIWLTQMPDRELSREEREETSATDVVAADKRDVDPKVWTPQHFAILRAAAQDPLVERVLINPAIKKALCRQAGTDRAWLHKVRPWWGHNYHFHVRVGCPAGSPECKGQDATPEGDGCGKELDYWFQPSILNPPPPKEPAKPKPPMTLADLPAACRSIVMAP